ncbi:MAG: hypothetical protein KatS3mg023_3750 [Armatimonadota bacterium]|nr:MAG: hypothetical protein KatS3mg023_3750 [Armatimonadota bacterium]
MDWLEIQSRLKQLGLRFTVHGHRIRSQCPCHHDNDPSLIIEWRANRLNVKCFAGCHRDQILRALGMNGTRNVTVNIPDFAPSHTVDTDLGVDILTAVWDNFVQSEQKLTIKELNRRGIRHNRYMVADACFVTRTIKRLRFSREEIIAAGLAYERYGDLCFRRVFDASRVIIPYFQDGKVISVRSRKVLDRDDTPRYLSLKGYPARVYIARAVEQTTMIVVEGEFKAMVLADHLPDNISVMALPGVTAAWNHLQQICEIYRFKSRFVLFDSEQDNVQVTRAAHRLARRIGAGVIRLQLMEGERRMAPDDFVMMYGVEPILSAINR